MKGNGKEADPRRNRKKHQKKRDGAQSQNRHAQAASSGEAPKNKGKNKKSTIAALMSEARLVRKKPNPAPRLKWEAPNPPAVDLQPQQCIWCDKAISDFSTAICDPETGKPVHFDCAVSRIGERENLEKGDVIGYIGGGRFGVINFAAAQNQKKFKIKKVLEWEKKEARSQWRVALSEHFSVT
jgi:hypothetical protein